MHILNWLVAYEEINWSISTILQMKKELDETWLIYSKEFNRIPKEVR